jgi:4-amino-4-deoxy-L-arabinose transferase-like glycosyltransferase
MRSNVADLQERQVAGASASASRKFAVVLGLIVLAACTGRVVYAVLLPHEQRQTYDQFFFKTEAITLARGHGFDLPAAFGIGDLGAGEHPPLPGLVLAPVAKVSGESDVTMRVVVALIGTGTVLLTALIAREIAGPGAAIAAAGIAAVYPNLWLSNALLLGETFATCAAALAVLLACRWVRAPSTRTAAAVGIACALAALSRGELVMVLPVLLLAVFLAKPESLARSVRRAGVAVLAAVLVIAPWQVYLLSEYEQPTLISYGSGGVLAGANCDPTYSGPDIGAWAGAFCPSLDIATARDPSVTAARKRHAAFEYARKHLGRLPIVIAAREGRLWSVYRPFESGNLNVNEGRPRALALWGLWMYWALLPLAIAGVLLLRRRGASRMLWPVLAPVAVIAVTAAVFYGVVRFREPAEVSLVVLAAVSVASVCERRSVT